ncbi:MAG: PilN domain-containing protein, partial [Actinomycetota bacterium]|nr:PilN domain-containing protein [Actinomycetota bacterium]
LKALMADDLPWATYTNKLRANAAAAGVTIAEISGNVSKEDTAGATNSGSAPAGSASTGSTSTGTVSAGENEAADVRPVGTVTLAGTSPDKPQIAVFIDKLANLPGFADPYLTSMSLNNDRYDYSISVKVTSAALCGRFTEPCTAAGGN